MSLHGAIDVVVSDVVELNPLIKRFHFRRPDGRPLPPFSGGAHVIVEMRDGERLRRSPYSLSSSPLDTSDYRISVRRDDAGRGGSLYLHEQVRPGMRMRLGMPANLFPLDLRAPKHLMFAGGIGITPFLAQTAQLMAAGGRFELHYGVRDRDVGAYVEELVERVGDRLHVAVGAEGEHIDFDRVLSSQPVGTHVYVCGPAPMIDHVRERAAALGWPASHVHHEHFAHAAPGEPFSVELRESGLRVEVAEDQSMLEAIESAGVDAPYLCRGGVCGQCETRVLSDEGELLHADHWLDQDEHASGDKVMPCVSRYRGDSPLVLDR